MIESVIQDLHYSLRILQRSPGFALAAILTLTLGMGATTGVFSVVHAVVLQPFPFAKADRLIDIWTTTPQVQGRFLNGAANYWDWRKNQTSFEDIALVRHVVSFNLTGGNDPERIQGASVTASLFPVLGVQPMLGRAFRDEEEQAGKDKVVLLSYRLWRRRFASDPGILGKSIQLNGMPYVVTGVMPPDFQYPEGGLPGLAPGSDFELWTPLTIDPDEYQTRIGFNYLCVGRLKPGVSAASAHSEMNRIAKSLANTYAVNKRFAPGVILSRMTDDAVGPVETPLYILLGVVITVLLVGCANLANLLIARSISRRQELTVRAALGASRTRLALQSFMEVIPIVLLGGLSGLFLADWMLDVVKPLLPPDMPRIENIAINMPVFIFAASMMLLTVLATGLWPALHAARWNLAESLRGVTRSASSDRRTNWTRDLLVVGQIAVVMVLLVGALLLVRSFIALKSVNPGFNPDNVLTMQLAIPRTRYPEDAKVEEFCRRIMDQVGSLPGVREVGMVNRLPLAFGTQVGTLHMESRDGEKTVDAVDWRTVTPDYFRAMGIPLIAGRFFDERDDTSHPYVGIIDSRIAKSVFGDENPLGKRFQIPFPGQPWVEIVGVVEHVHHDGLNLDPRGQVYWNYLQRPQDRMALVARVTGDPESIAASVLARIHVLDPEQPVYDVRPMREVLNRSVSDQSLTAELVGLFAIISLALAMLGVYGVMSYVAGQRAREIGIRVALGARRNQILAMILRDGSRLIGEGLLAGVLGSLLLKRAVQSLLYNVSSTDTISFFAAFLIIAGVALLACYIPARRAASGDPIIVLRTE